VTLAAAILFVVLHRVDGNEIALNPQQITSLRSVPGSMSRHIMPPGNCLVGLTDGKHAAVLESCAEVRRILEAVGRKAE
jgi:uncharacterized protein YlzI (FlbEa/FlbD family)